MSDKDDLHFYEKEWLNEHELRREAERRFGDVESALRESAQRVELLERRLERANRLLEEAEEARELALGEAAEAKKQGRQETESARETTARLQQELNLLKARINGQDFWHREFALLLASDLDSLDGLINETASPQDWTAVFALWHEEILEGLQGLAQREGPEQGEQVRRLVLAQWVYLRWLEVANLCRVGVSP